MKTESVYPEHREECARDEVLVLIDDYIHWYNHARIKRSFGWMSPVECRQKPRKGCVTVSKKTSAALFHAECGGEFDDPGIGEPLGVFGVERPLSCKGNSCGNAVSSPRVFRQVAPRHPSARTSIASLSSIMGCAKRRLFRYISGRFMRESHDS